MNSLQSGAFSSAKRFGETSVATPSAEFFSGDQILSECQPYELEFERSGALGAFNARQRYYRRGR